MPALRRTSPGYGRRRLGAGALALLTLSTAGLLRLVPGAVTHAAGQPCVAEAEQRVAPSQIVLGDTVAVTLDLRLSCDAAPAPVDVVLVVDRSASMAGPSLADAVAAVDAFVAAADFSRTRVALVSFAADVSRDARLSADPDLVRGAARRLVADGNTFIAGGLREAGRVLQDAVPVPGAVPVIVLLTDGHDSLGAEAVRSQAALQRAGGRYLVTIALGLRADRALLAEIASSPADAWYAPHSTDLAKIYASISGRLMAVVAVALTVVNRLPDGMPLVSGTLRPPNAGSASMLVWRVPGLPAGAFRATFRLRPQLLGWQAVSLAATAEYTDTRGLAGSASFPVPRVLVLAEAPTPSPTVTPTVDPGPTQTPSRTPVTPATPEPTATRKPGSGGPGWHPLYMPLAVNSWCLRDEPNEHLGGCR